MEDNKEDGSLPFLDTIVKTEADGGLSITVYRKPTHTDQYLQCDSHHNLPAKFSVLTPSPIGAKTVCSNPELLQQEKEHLRKALTKCKYPKWALDKVEKRFNRSSSEAIDGVNNPGTTGTHAATNEVKARVTLSYPTHKVFVKASKTSAVDMASKPTSKVAAPSRASWSPPRTKTYGQPKLCHLFVAIRGTRLWWWIHRGNLQGLWWKIQRASEGSLTHSSTQISKKPPYQPYQLPNNREGGAQFS